MRIKISALILFLSLAASVRAAMSFNGSSTTDYASVPDSTSLNVIGNQLTLNFWIKTSSAAQCYVIFKQSDAGSVGYAYNLQATGVARLDIHNAGFNSLTGTKVVNDGNWHMVTGTYDGVNFRQYIDAIEDGNSPKAESGNITSSAGSICYLGSSHAASGNSSPWPGSIDDILILNYPLTLAQVQSLYQSRGKQIITPCAGHWRLDEMTVGSQGSGGTLKDLCGNGNTATLSANVGNGPVGAIGILNYP